MYLYDVQHNRRYCYAVVAMYEKAYGSKNTRAGTHFHDSCAVNRNTYFESKRKRAFNLICSTIYKINYMLNNVDGTEIRQRREKSLHTFPICVCVCEYSMWRRLFINNKCRYNCVFR